MCPIPGILTRLTPKRTDRKCDDRHRPLPLPANVARPHPYGACPCAQSVCAGVSYLLLPTCGGPVSSDLLHTWRMPAARHDDDDDDDDNDDGTFVRSFVCSSLSE